MAPLSQVAKSLQKSQLQVARNPPTDRLDAMNIGLATAGAVIGTIVALLKQLQSFEQHLNPDDGDPAHLNDVARILGLQRSTFEDTILELLYDVLPSADLAAFFKAPQDARWQEEPVQAKANERLGEFAKRYWQTCKYIQTLLLDFKQDADKVLLQGQVVGGINSPESFRKLTFCEPLEVRPAVLLAFPRTEDAYTKIMGR